MRAFPCRVVMCVDSGYVSGFFFVYRGVSKRRAEEPQGFSPFTFRRLMGTGVSSKDDGFERDVRLA